MGEARNLAGRSDTGIRNELDMYFTDYIRVADGKIVECEAVWDRLGMDGQLGGTVGGDVGHLPALLLERPAPTGATGGTAAATSAR